MKFLRRAQQLCLDFFSPRPKEPLSPVRSRAAVSVRKSETQDEGSLQPDDRKRHDELRSVWSELQFHYFPNREDILSYTLVWSGKKHRRTLASCNVERKRISVAPVMELEQARPYLPALLYHEMCHAALESRGLSAADALFTAAILKPWNNAIRGSKNLIAGSKREAGIRLWFRPAGFAAQPAGAGKT